MQTATPDSLRAVLDSVFAGPDYRWVERPDPLGFLHRWWLALQDWLIHVHETSPALFEVVFWTMLTAVVLIFVHGGWIIFHTVRSAGAGPDEPARPAAVPMQDAAWHLAEADRLAAGGHFVEAVQAAFRGLLLDLDRVRLLRFHPSKTPAEYLAERTLSATQRDRLRQLVRALYGFVFAGQRCGDAEYREWRRLAGGDWHATAH
jgi:hypothetical protein